MLRQFKLLRLLAAVAVALSPPSVLRAQAPDTAGTPRVERLTFAGAEALRDHDLRTAIVTDQTRCRGLLLQPFCAITDWRPLHVRRYLDREELRRDELRLRIYYFQRGYRQASVASRIEPRGRGVEVIFDIDEGPPTRIESMRVEQTRDVLRPRQIRRAALPEQGEPLDLLRLSSGIVRLDDRLGRAGHLDGQVHDSVVFDATGLRAWLSVVIDPGPRTVLRDLAIEGNDDVSDRTIADALMLRRGRTLRNTDLAGSQRSLYESNLFHEARVRVPEQQDSAKIVEVEVREAPPRSARVGGGFNTVEFIQTEARFTHYNWHGGGRRLDARVTVGNLLADQLNDRGIFRNVLPEGHGAGSPFTRPTWLASAELMQPAFRAAENAIGISVFTHRRVIPAIAIDQGFGGEVSFTRRFDYRTPASLSYRYEMVRVDAGDVYFCVNYGICEVPTVAALRERHTLSPVGLSYFADQANNPLGPTSGYRLRVDLEHASAATLSDFRYNRISSSAAGYHALDVHRRRVLAGRLRAGWVAPLDGTSEALGLGEPEWARLLHPRKRFYAGGARSVRGYRENQLGPRVLTVDPARLVADAGCALEEVTAGTCDPNAEELEDGEFLPRPAGGRNVIEASIEYRFPLSRTLQGAAFIDGARVGNSPGGMATRSKAAITPGFGARYASPVGPIRVDLGIRTTGIEELPVVTEVIGADGERQLVRLETMRRYNPLGGDRGLLRQVLGRLTLHLAIGEAY